MTESKQTTPQDLEIENKAEEPSPPKKARTQAQKPAKPSPAAGQHSTELDGNKGKTQAKEAATLLRKCLVLKKDIMIARGEQSTLFTNIETMPTWEFAVVETKKLEAWMKDMEYAKDTHRDFSTILMNVEGPALRRRFDTETLLTNLREFEAAVAEPVAKLKEFQEKLHKMHDIRKS